MKRSWVMYPDNSKLLPQPQLLNVAAQRRAQGQRLVFTNGCFDLLHWGHLRYLKAARALGDFLVVGLNSDASVEALKGKTRPLFSQAHRAELLAGLVCVDYVTVFCELTANKLVEALKPDVYVKGGDWEDLESLPEADTVLKNGGKIKLVENVEGISTTKIIQALTQGRRRL
jgi:rfaE bifunctional protein nucleotidyltransferase chain/domain